MKLDNNPKLEIWLRRTAKKTRRILRRLEAYSKPWMEDIPPDFLGIGAPRAASTWLHNRLAGHPELFLPHEKELHFFDSRDVNGDFQFDVQSAADRRWYTTHFSKGKGRIVGEITPAYSFLPPERVREILEYAPRVKIIYILRNPIERAWSGIRRRCWYNIGKNAEFVDSSRLLEIEQQQDVLIRGDYRNNIEVWESQLAHENILYLFFDDIQENGQRELEKTCAFLGANPQLIRPRQGDQSAVNQAPQSTMPREVKDYLRSKYISDQDYLERKFNRNLSSWYV